MDNDKNGPSQDRPTLLDRISALLMREPEDRDDLIAIMRGAFERKLVDGDALSMIEGVLSVSETTVRDIMIPRAQMDCVSIDDDPAEFMPLVVETRHSRFPVIDGDPNAVAGIIQVKDLLEAQLQGKPIDLRALLRPPLYLPNTVTALRALEMLKKSGEPMALVVDEYGDFEGVVTLTDIMEALVGDIATPGEEENPPVVTRDDGSWLIDGMVPVDEIKDVIGLTHLPGEETGDFQTLGGFIMAQVNRVPRVADHFIIEGFRFEVVDMDGRRVDRVLILPPKANARRPAA